MQQHISFEALEKELVMRMEARRYAPATVTCYKYLCSSIFAWLRKAGFTSYSEEGGDHFLQDYLEKNGRNDYYSSLRTAVCRLNDLVQDTWKEIHSDRERKFSLSDEFIFIVDAYGKWGEENGLAPGTIRIKRYAVSVFLEEICRLGCCSIKQLSVGKVAAACVKISDHNLWGEIRIFLRYLADLGITEADYSTAVPRRSRPYVIPSIYSIGEIKLVEAAVDTSTTKGKRDYAMLLLASRMGLRSGDIVKLKVSDVGHNRDRLCIVQEKTGNTLHLPMIEEAGAAIDSCLTARPKTGVEELFLSVRAPYHAVTTSVLRHILREYMDLSNIDIGDRRHGPHSLRASLASSMVNDSVPYEAVRKILGHSSDNAIKHYARIDVEKLRPYSLTPFEPTGRFQDFLNGRCM